VIATASPANHDFLRELGAEPADYNDGAVVEQVRGLAGHHGIDAAFDLFGGAEQEQALELLRPGGRIVSVASPPQPRDHIESSYVFVRPSGYDLAEMSELIADGRLRPHVEETFPLERAAEALERLENGHVRGKLVLTVD
jgi:NADPH:quinone reductase-like Zn-dependent oxidoreductase